MDPEKIKVWAILAAYEILLVKLFGMVYTLTNFDHDEILKLHDAFRKKMPEWTLLKVDDPAVSDLMSAEVAEVVKEILEKIEKLIGLPPQQSS
jgi:hypothetical protein